MFFDVSTDITARFTLAKFASVIKVCDALIGLELIRFEKLSAGQVRSSSECNEWIVCRSEGEVPPPHCRLAPKCFACVFRQVVGSRSLVAQT
jgi:hypothetical protein